jgi:hypothetical protein
VVHRVVTQLPFERAGLGASEADSVAVTLLRCSESAASLKNHLQSVMRDGVCERDAVGPWQYDAARLAVPKLKMPRHDGTRPLVMSPLKAMQRVAVPAPRHRWPVSRVARGPNE